MEEKNEVQTYSSKTNSIVLDSQSFDAIMKFATMMASGKATIPKHLQGNPSDCAAIVIQAMQWGMSPHIVAQKTHLIGGVLGYEAQLVNAIINTLAPIQSRMNFKWDGDWTKIIGKFKEGESKTKFEEDGVTPKKYRVPAWKMEDEKGLNVTVWATMKGETEPRVMTVDLLQARTRNSTLWADDPKQQLAYLAIKKWCRLHCPDVLMGVYTEDELAPPELIIINPEDAPKPEPEPETGEAQQALYPQADYEKNFDSWRKLITERGKSPEAIIKQAESKGALTATQKDEIRNGKKPIIEGEKV